MSVSRDKKRGTWTVEAWYRNSMGERHKKTKRGFASKKEAVAWERDFRLLRRACRGHRRGLRQNHVRT